MKTRIPVFPGTSVYEPLRGLCVLALVTSVISAGDARAQPTDSTVATASAEPAMVPDADGFRRIAQPFFKQFCIDCHGPDLQEGEFRVDESLPNDFLNLTTIRALGRGRQRSQQPRNAARRRKTADLA